LGKDQELEGKLGLFVLKWLYWGFEGLMGLMGGSPFYWEGMGARSF